MCKVQPLIFIAFVVIRVVSLPMTGVRYTLYDAERTWNEARAICEGHSQVMLKLNTAEKHQNFNAVKAKWLNDGVLTDDMWLGLVNNGILASTFQWGDCDQMTYSDWDVAVGEPDKLTVEICVRFRTSTDKFRTRACGENYQVVCEENIECEFEVFPDKTVSGLTMLSSQNIGLTACQEECVVYSGSGQCVAIAFKSVPETCEIYIKPTHVFGETISMTTDTGTSVYAKQCVFETYETTMTNVPDNDVNNPIIVCPSSSSSSLSSSSSSLSSSSSYLSSHSTPTIQEASYELFTSSSFDMPEISTYTDFNSFPSMSAFLVDIVSSQEVETYIESTIEPSNMITSGVYSLSSHEEGFLVSSISILSNYVYDATESMMTSGIDTSDTSTIVITSETPPPPLCLCACSNHSVNFLSIYQHLSTMVDKKDLSSYRRSKTSAPDERTSSKVIGGSGLGVVVGVLLMIMCMDLDRILYRTKLKRK